MAEKTSLEELAESWEDIVQSDLQAALGTTDYPSGNATVLNSEFFLKNVSSLIHLIKEKVRSLDGLVAGDLSDIQVGDPSQEAPTFGEGILPISAADNATDILAKFNQIIKYLAENAQGNLTSATAVVEYTFNSTDFELQKVFGCYDDDADFVKTAMMYMHDQQIAVPTSIKITLSEIRSPESGLIVLNKIDMDTNTSETIGGPFTINAEDNSDNSDTDLIIEDYRNPNQWYESLKIRTERGNEQGLMKFRYEIDATNNRSIFICNFDSAGALIDVSSGVVTEGADSKVKTSGLDNYTSGGSYTVRFSVANLFDKFYPRRSVNGKDSVFLEVKAPATPKMYLNADPVDPFSNTSVEGTVTNDIPDPDQNSVFANMTFSVSEDGQGLISTQEVSIYDPREKYAERKDIITFDKKVALNNIAVSKQTDLYEDFTDEVRRVKSYTKASILGVYDTPASFSDAGNVFDSSLSLVDNWATHEEAAVYAGSLRHQAQDFSANIPVGIDYSGLTGDGMFVRRFDFGSGSNVNGMKISLNGISAQDITNNLVEVHIKFPSATIWMNAETYFNGSDVWTNAPDNFIKGCGAGAYTKTESDGSTSANMLINPGSNTADQILVMVVVKDSSIVINSIEVEAAIAYTVDEIRVHTVPVTSTHITNKKIPFPDEVVEPSNNANICGWIKNGGFGEPGEDFVVNNSTKEIDFDGYAWENILTAGDDIRFEYKAKI